MGTIWLMIILLALILALQMAGLYLWLIVAQKLMAENKIVKKLTKK